MWLRLLCVAAILVLSGCDGDGQFSDLRSQMEEIKKRPKGNIEAPPEFKAYTTFTYSAAALRSPFSPPMDVQLVAEKQQKSALKPDFDRPKEPLEEFGVDSLTMVGTLKRPGGALFALIQDPNGGLSRVTAGNHLGRNFGKIVSITPEKLELTEIVSDGQDGWIERPRSIVLREQN
ncbi:Type IV fimbrial biogenesis protein, involved in pilus assembly [gamma proteobacterium HdN1]|nr:Type IV fimbrial biogenesis protein, involved in pilus assembly [gamma proteobacterium HdN1]